MKVAIVTFHKALSCGAMLQAWALRRVLERMGHQVEFPACNSVGLDCRRWPFRVPDGLPFGKRLGQARRCILSNLMSLGIPERLCAGYAAFRTAHLPERDVRPEAFAQHYDLVVFGSDQIWNPRLTGAEAGYFAGIGLPDGLPRIAYAASLGDERLPDAELERLSAALRRFSALSAREPSVASQFSRWPELAFETVLDPTLLLSRDDYAPLVVDNDRARPYLFVYTLQDNWWAYDLARRHAERRGLDLVYAPLYQYTRYKMPRETVYALTPDRFVNGIAHAECVLTDSFHGTALATIFGKPMVSLRMRPEHLESRPASLLRRLDLSERLVVWRDDCARQVDDLLSAPLPDGLRDRLVSVRADSLAWLEAAVGRGGAK